jgi:dipeptidyl aminopeptidase/acylaminoacyl peptidase
MIATLILALTAAADLRPLQPNDMFRIEKFGEVAVAPDGRNFVYVRIRGKATAKFHMRDFMSGLDRADIWLASTAASAGPPRNLTDGGKDGSGWFLPAWSPDGKRLAMLSTRGGDNIRLWVWEQSSGMLRMVSRIGVEFARPVWMSPTVVLCASPPESRKATQLVMDFQNAERMTESWPQAWRGTQSTASVLETGNVREPAKGALWRFDVSSGSGRSTLLQRGNFTSITPSPDGRRIAVLEAVDQVRPVNGQRMPNRNPVIYRLKIIGNDGTGDQVNDVVPGSIRWSGDGTKAAVQSRVSQRPNDWVVAGSNVNLTASFKVPPATIVGALSGFVAVSEGKLWLMDASSGGAPRRIVESFSKRIDSILTAAGDSIVVSAEGATQYSIALKTGNARIHIAPTTTVKRGRHYLSYEGRQIDSTNAFLDEIAEGTLRHVPYQSTDGQALNAWALLPPGYREGTRYPTVVWVYGGLVHPPTPPPYYVGFGDAGPYSLQLLAARGYIVLLPSIPLKPESEASDPYLDLPKGVLPAIDKAVEMGFVNPNRVAVAGHSYGGYSTYSLITQTNRFKASIAMAGFCNLVSLYGSVDARFRHEDATARDRLLHMVFSESGQFRLGGPPYQDMDRYIRNSPITYASRVTTPLMIVQGDMDYVPIQQGEEFYTAMFRQNKPASFVRYWGEGHILQSPPNILDLWERIFTWMDRYLRS